MIKVAVMASGGGSNFQAILDRIKAGLLHAKVVLLISNNSKSGAMEKARAAGVEALHLAPSAFAVESEYAQTLQGHLSRTGAELIVLAGYMRKLPKEIVRQYRNRILNIHPALLPAFGGKGMYGDHVHEGVIEYGARITGVTVHLVDEEYDDGAIVMQKAVEVDPNDTADSLAARVLTVEHDTYWRAIELFAQGRVHITGRKVLVK